MRHFADPLTVHKQPERIVELRAYIFWVLLRAEDVLEGQRAAGQGREREAQPRRIVISPRNKRPCSGRALARRRTCGVVLVLRRKKRKQPNIRRRRRTR